MSQLKHSHKFTMFSEVFKFIISKIVPFIIFLVSIGSIGLKFPEKYGGNYTVNLGVIAVVVVSIILAIVKWNKNTYELEDETMYIKYGVFMLHERTVPFSQVQSADVSSSVVQRLFNVCKIEIDTAREDEKPEISIFLSKAEALRVKNIIFKGNENNDEVQFMEERNIKKFTPSLKDLFMMATISGRILAGFFIIIGIYFKIDDIVPNEFKRRAQVFSEDAIKGVYATSSIKYRVAMLFIILFVSWMISIIVTITKDYKFTVIRKEDNIKLSYGLFDKKEVTIPVKRIQSLIIVDGVIKKSLGYCSLNVETIGYGKDKGGKTMICPSVKRKVLNKFLEDILPEMNITYDLRKSPLRALMGFILFRVLCDCIVMSIIAINIPRGYYVFLLVPILMIWNYIRFIDNGLYCSNDFVVMRYRILARKTVIIQKKCILSIDKVQNGFQKRKAIAKYKVTIAGNSLGKSYSVGYMDEYNVGDIILK